MNNSNILEFEEALVRILDDKEQTIGAGLLIDAQRGLIATCYHVVTGDQSDKPVDIDLPQYVLFSFHIEEINSSNKSGESLTRKAEILRPWLPFSKGDIIILNYSGEIPEIVKSHPIGESTSLSTRDRYFSTGFPERGVNSISSRGTIFPNLSKSPFGFDVKLLTDEDGTIINGFSGAPVYNESTGNIIGLISWIFLPDKKTGRYTKTAAIIPSELILKVVPKPFKLKPIGTKLLQTNTLTHKSRPFKPKADFIYCENSAVSEETESFFVEFKSYSVTELKAELLLGRTAWDNFNSEFYYSRPKVDDKIKELTEKRKAVVLFGQSLTGKSRAIYQFLKSTNEDSKVIIASLKKVSQNKKVEYTSELNICELAIDEIIGFNNQRTYFIFNDLDKFLDVSGIDDLLEQIIFSPYSLLSTCREDEYELVTEELLNIVNDSKWKEVYVPRLQNEEVSHFRGELKKHTNLNPKEDDVDATIGSYFLNLGEMRKYYLQFEKENNIEKHILWALKTETVIRNNSKGQSKFLKEYVELQRSRDLEELIVIPSEDWEESLQKLKRIGFLYEENIEITDKNGSTNRFRVEEVYFKKIVVSKSYLLKERRGATELELLLFREKELKTEVINSYERFTGKYLSPISNENLTSVYNRLVVKIRTESLKVQTYNEMIERGLHPDLYVLNGMIRKAKSLEAARKNYFNKILSYGYLPDSSTLTFMVGQNNNLKEALNTYKELSENYLIKPDTYTLRIFIKLAQKGDFHFIWPIFNEIKAQSEDKTIKEEGLYYGIIEIVEFFSDARLVFNEYKDNEVAKHLVRKYPTLDGENDGKEMNIRFYESVIYKSGGEIKDLLEIYETLKTTANFGQIKPHTFASLIERTTENEFELAKSFLQDAKNLLGNRLQPTVYTNLIKKCDSFSQAIYFLEDMLSFGLNKITPNPFNKILSFAKKAEEAERIFKLMSRYGVHEDEDTRPYRVRHSTSIEQAFNYIDEIYETNNSDLTLRLINEALSLLSKEDDWSKRGEWAEYFYIYIDSEELYAEQTQNKVNRSFSLLIRNYRNTKARLEKISYAIEYGAIPSESNYWHCIFWSRTWEEIENTFKMMSKNSVMPTVETIIDAVRKLVKDTNYTFLKFSTFVSFLNQSFPTLEPDAYKGLFDIVAKTNVRPNATEELKKLYGQLSGMGKEISDEGYEILLWKEISNQKEDIDLKLIREIYREEYNRVIKIPTTYFENFFRRCSNYRTISLLYEDMVALNVPRRVQTYEVMLDTVTKKRNYSLSQIQEIIHYANECNPGYPELLFDDLLKRPFPDNKRISLYDRLLKKGIKLSNQAKQDIFWLKINKHNQSKSKNETREAFLLDSIEDRKSIPNFLQNCVDFEDAIILLRKASVKNKNINAEVFETVIWLATSKEQVDEVVEMLSHRKIEKNLTVLCRQIKYAENMEEAVQFYHEGVKKDSKFSSSLAYNVMRRADSFSEAYDFFLKNIKSAKRFIPAFQHLLARHLLNSEDAVIYSDFLREHSIILENETNKKLLFLLPGEIAWPYFEFIGEQLKHSQKNSLFRRLWQNLNILKENRTTFSLNQVLKKLDISFKEILFYLKMAEVLEIDLNSDIINEITKKRFKLSSNKVDELFRVLEGQSNELFFSSLEKPRLAEEEQSNQIVPEVKQKKVSKLPFKDQWEILLSKYNKNELNILPTKKSHAQFNSVLDASEKLENVLKIKNLFDQADVLYSTKLFHKLILYTQNTEKCIDYLDRFLRETTLNPHMILSSLVKSNHDPLLKQKLVTNAINAGRNIPEGIIKKLGNDQLIQSLNKEEKSKSNRSNKDSFQKRITRAESFKEAKEIYIELTEYNKKHNRKVNEDILKAYLNQAQTFSQVDEVKREIIKQKFPITEDVYAKAYWSAEATFEDIYSVFKEVENNKVFKFTSNHYYHLLKKNGGAYEKRKYLFDSMKSKGLKKIISEIIKQTFRATKNKKDSFEFYQYMTYNCSNRPKEIYFSLSLDNIEISFADAVEYLKLISTSVEIVKFQDQKIKNKFLPGKISYEKIVQKIPSDGNEAAKELFNLIKDSPNNPKLTVDAYNYLIELVDDRQIAIDISEDMKSKRVKKNHQTQKLLQQYIIPGK